MFKNLWWLVPLSVVVSFIASLFVVWLLSKIFGFQFDSTAAVIVGMLTAASSGTSITAIFLTQRKE